MVGRQRLGQLLATAAGAGQQWRTVLQQQSLRMFDVLSGSHKTHSLGFPI